MKGRTGSTLSRTKYIKCFIVETNCYRLVLWLNFIVTVELLYDQVESDFVQCQTTMRAFASGIELDWNGIVHQNALWILVFSSTRPWNKQISASDASQPSSQERWQVADLKHLYDQVESDFVQCQTPMRAFASRIELDWNGIVHQNALWILVFSSTRPWNKQISASDASQPSSQERWQVADLKHLKTSDIFSLPRINTKDFAYIKGKINWSIGINYSSVNFKWTQVFVCCQSFDRRGQWIF